MTRTRVFIWGSCVSRDTFEHLPPAEFELLAYVARQSALSACSTPVTLVQPPVFESPFQQRMVAGDFMSSLRGELVKHAAEVDLLLIDLTDERLGVHVLPDGSVVTRSVELLRSGAESTLPAGTRSVPFGSTEHLRHFAQSIDTLGRLVRRTLPRAAVALLDIPWAEVSELGGPSPGSFGVSASRANQTYPDYVDVVLRHLSPLVVRVDAPRSSPAHPWGEAPFHYADDVYREIVRKLTGALDRSR